MWPECGLFSTNQNTYKTIMPRLRFRWDSTRRERECEGYIRLVYHVLNMFLAHLEALGKMLVNQSRVKGNENVSTLSHSFCTRVWMSAFVRSSSHSHLSKSLVECLWRECKLGIIVRNLWSVVIGWKWDTFGPHATRLHFEMMTSTGNSHYYLSDNDKRQ